MSKSKSFATLIAAAIALAFTTSSYAQSPPAPTSIAPPPPPRPPIRPHTPSAANISFKVLDDALDLSQKQETEITDLQSEGRAKWPSETSLVDDPVALQAQVDASDASTAAKITALLDDHQRQVLVGLLNEITILRDDALPAIVAVQLHVTSDQLEKIDSINELSLADIREQRKQYKSTELPDGMMPNAEGEMVRSVTAKRIHDMLAVLTPEQQGVIQSYTLLSPLFGKFWNKVLSAGTPQRFPVKQPSTK